MDKTILSTRDKTKVKFKVSGNGDSNRRGDNVRITMWVGENVWVIMCVGNNVLGYNVSG